jgi:uroporphyrinogen-III synthase
VVVLTREEPDNRDLARALEDAGVAVRQIPCVATRLRDPDPDEVRDLPAAGRVGALAFTSRRAVRGWMRWAPGSAWSQELGKGSVVVAAVGPATAGALERAGIGCDLVAEPPTGESLARSLAGQVQVEREVVLVAGETRAGGLERELARAGRTLRILTLYASEPPAVPSLEPFEVAAVFVASPLTGRRLIDANPWIAGSQFVSIGPTTTRALHEMGVERVEEPGPRPGDWLEALLRAGG